MNPYAAPRAVEPASYDVPLTRGIYATYGKRLGGAMIDGFAIMIVGMVLSRIVALAFGVQLTQTTMRFCYLAVHAVNWVLLVQRGQTVGKMVLGTKVVRTDGSRAGFVHAVALRALPLIAIGLLELVFAPFRTVAVMLSAADGLAIFFASQYRTLHDRLAGTIVIDLKASAAWQHRTFASGADVQL